MIELGQTIHSVLHCWQNIADALQEQKPHQSASWVDVTVKRKLPPYYIMQLTVAYWERSGVLRRRQFVSCHRRRAFRSTARSYLSRAVCGQAVTKVSQPNVHLSTLLDLVTRAVAFFWKSAQKADLTVVRYDF